MIYKKDLRDSVTAVIKANGGNCSVCNQQIDSCELSFAKMRGIKTSWQKCALSLFVPGEITFTIPYTDIVTYGNPCSEKQLEIELSGRRLVSIRGLL